MSGSLSVAVVGLGFGRMHVHDVLRLDGLDLVAVVDVDEPDKNGRLAGDAAREQILAVPHVRSLDELFARGVPDIVVLATPIHTHAELAEAALRAGAHVLLEKPPTATLREHARLVSLAQAQGRSVQVGFQARGGGGLAAVRAAVDAGEIGDVVRLAAVGRWVRTRGYYRRAPWAGRRTLAGMPVMDGALTNPFAHAVDVALSTDGSFFAEDIVEVRIDAWHAHEIEADDTTSVIIRTRRGTEIAIALTLCAEAEEPSPTVRVIGTKGELRLHYTEDRLERRALGTTMTARFGRQSLLENLADHIRGGVDLISPLDRAGAFMAILEASRDATGPRSIPSHGVSWSGVGDAGRPVVHGIDDLCEQVASTGQTFSQLGAPWTRVADKAFVTMAHQGKDTIG